LEGSSFGGVAAPPAISACDITPGFDEYKS
jgi:hypothetical protein